MGLWVCQKSVVGGSLNSPPPPPPPPVVTESPGHDRCVPLRGCRFLLRCHPRVIVVQHSFVTGPRPRPRAPLPKVPARGGRVRVGWS